MNLVFAVHGVGPTKESEVRNSLKELLDQHGHEAEVHEFHWAQLEAAPVIGESIGIFYAWEFAWMCVSASFIESRHRGWYALWKQGNWTILLADLARVLIFGPMVLLPFLAVLTVLLSWGGDYLLGYGDDLATPWVYCVWRGTTWAIIVGAILTCLVLAVDTVLAIFTWNSSLATTSFRRNLLHLLGPTIGAAFLPFAIPWAKNKTKFVLGIAGYISFFSLSALVVTYIESFFHIPGETIYDPPSIQQWIVISLGVIGSIVIFILLFAALGAKLVPWIVKVSLDVVRYTGNSRYRQHLQQTLRARLTAHIQQLTEMDTLFLLGHSLGSVILLDHLLNWASVRPRCRVVFITGGSPIRRLFATFFAEQFFPKSIAHTSLILGVRYPSFQWINVFRPWDPIGGAMGFCDSSCAIDINSRQNKSILTAHLNYWSDGEILQKILGVSLPGSLESYSGSLQSNYQIPHDDYRSWLGAPLFSRMYAAWFPLFATALPAGAIAGLLFMVCNALSIVINHEQVMQRGEVALATVNYHREIVQMKDSMEFVERFKVMFSTSSGIRVSDEITINATYPYTIAGMGYYIDHVTLSQFVMDHDYLGNKRRPLQAKSVFSNCLKARNRVRLPRVG